MFKDGPKGQRFVAIGGGRGAMAGLLPARGTQPRVCAPCRTAREAQR